MLFVENLKKVYRSRKKVVEAVKGISFKAYEGEVFAILGPNGAGKTTTIKSILGLVIPDEGRILIDGIDALKERRKVLKMISAVLEGNRNIHWRLTVKENMEYFGAIKGMKMKEIRKRMYKILERLGILEKASTLAGRMSRGQQQKLAVAIALLPDCPIILLDEPTLGLDVESAIEIREMIKEEARKGKLVLLSTHDMNLVEKVADRVMIMNNGKIVALDEKEKLKDMFKRKSYRVVLSRKPSENILKKLENMIKIVDNGEKFIFDVDLSSSDIIYDLFEILGEDKPPIESIEAEFPNFESIFLRIVRSDE